MDMTETIKPRSDQLNADDFITGPATFTISAVTKGTPDQPVNVELMETPGRPFKPSKSMRRVLVAVWGKDSSAYVGQRLTLYRDPDVTFGREKVGGIRISHMSGLAEEKEIRLTTTRGRRAPFTVHPLPTVTDEQINAATTTDRLRQLWDNATPTQREHIQTKAQQLQEQQ